MDTGFAELVSKRVLLLGNAGLRRLLRTEAALWLGGQHQRVPVVRSVTAAALDMRSEPEYSFAVATGKPAPKTDVLQGTLDLMVLQTLETMGPLHGYGIARRIEQVSDSMLSLNEGTVYASLMRLQHNGWIDATWGLSENNRKAKFYTITRQGRRQLNAETENWHRIASVIGRLLRTPGGA